MPSKPSSGKFLFEGEISMLGLVFCKPLLEEVLLQGSFNLREGSVTVNTVLSTWRI